MQFESLDAILDFAIRKEEEAANLYMRLADEVRRPGMREAFLEFADQEKGHRAKLIQVRKTGLTSLEGGPTATLGITEHLTDVTPSPAMTYAEALQFAMRAEQAAYDLYSGLAALAPSPAAAGLFRSLAEEEKRHKQRFEHEYEDVVLEGV